MTLMEELRRRGGGVRESGAFLLSPVDGDGRTVTQVAYYDDLDPKSLEHGGVSLSSSAYPQLWDLCEREHVRVVGDIHTHPGKKVRQSSIDTANPMLAKVGHIAMIAPSFGTDARVQSLGFHVYLGEKRWQSHFGKDVGRLIYVGRWA